jgi:hypothetical protein
MRSNAIAAALAVNVALAGGVAYLWSDADRARWAEPAPLPPALEDVVPAPAAEPADVARYRETVERPLFAATRRPAPRADQEAEKQAAADTLKDVRLLGTYGAGERGGIIVVRGGKVERIAVGERIGGWQVAGSGQGRNAELVRGDGQRRQLELALNNVAPAAPAAAGRAEAKADGRADGSQAAPAGAADPARPAEPAQGGTSQRASVSRGGALSEDARRQRREQIDARRAARGLPPLTR